MKGKIDKEDKNDFLSMYERDAEKDFRNGGWIWQNRQERLRSDATESFPTAL